MRLICPGSAGSWAGTLVPALVRAWIRPNIDGAGRLRRALAFGLVAVSMALGAGGILSASAAADTYCNINDCNGSQSFSETGGGQSFTVPEGISQITIDAIGAAGAGTGSDDQGALGGEAIGTVPVTPGQVLEVVVGEQPDGGGGGYNGGGSSSAEYGGGGGESDVRAGSCASSNNCPASDAIVVAGGGGGSTSEGGLGGAGGGNGDNGSPANYQSGDSGNGQGGFGGTQSGFGAGGHGGGEGQGDYYASGTNGSANHGGNGGGGGCSGGGGGAGYWGGGGGGGSEPSNSCGSGGGGASYVEPGASSTYNSGVSSNDSFDANGLVTISWCCVSDTYGTPEDSLGNDLAEDGQAAPINAGTQVIDNAEVYPDSYNDPRYPTGTVNFSLCGPLTSAQAASGCAPGQGYAVGGPVGFQDEGTPPLQWSNANSSTFTPQYKGTYCFLASYGGDGTYTASTDGTYEDQCFVVNTGPTQPTSTTKSTPASGTVPYGSSTDDVATVTGSNPTGSVSFSVCGPPATSCASGGTSLGSANLSSGSATSPSFTPAQFGTYCFRATYAGDANNAGSSDSSSDGCFTFIKAVVHVDANPASKNLGASDPSPSGTLRASDFQNGDTASVVSGSPSCTIASHSQNAGTYYGAITCTAGSVSATNYSFAGGNAANLTINQGSVQTSMAVDDAASNGGWSGSEVAGASAYDTSSVSGVNGFTPTGSVTYSLFANSSCSPPADGTVQTSILNGDGSVPNSSPTGPLAQGSYSYQATYSGDTNYPEGTIACEPFSVLAPDLSAAETDGVGGQAALGNSWTWSVQVANSGNGDATFSDGQTILTDDLPSSDIGYGSPNVSNVTDVSNSGNISCQVNSDVLSCVASGSSVTIGASGGTFTVGVLATPTSTGTYTSPAGGGTCAVDPNSVITEAAGSYTSCGDTLVVVAPNLSATETDNVGGQTTLGNSWTWSVVVANGGSGDATFSDGQTILTDDLPSSNIGYGTPSVSDVTVVTNSGNISCQVSSDVLSCTASGGPVTIGASFGTFTVGVLATPSAAGSYVSPATSGTCAADPNSVITEAAGADTSCGDTVVVDPDADLSASETDDVGGQTVLGNRWTWSVAVANTGAGDATFASGETILTDDLPSSNIAYRTVSVSGVSGVKDSGDISCQVSSDVLSCVASGGPVTLGASTGSFDVSVLATPSATGAFASPAGGGVCAVDPNAVITEPAGADTSCSDSVLVLATATVSQVSPASGTLAGGTPITITGTGFVSGAVVEIAQGQGAGPTAVAATGVNVVSSTEITATTAGATKAGKFNLFVLEGGQSSSPNSGDDYTYGPTVSQVSPASGTLAGGTPITITGTGFVSGAVVEIAQGQGLGPTAVPATGVNVVSPTEITATAAGATNAGRFNLFVLEGGASSTPNSGDEYTYAPAVSQVSPASGTLAGGTPITITGTGFVSGAVVEIAQGQGAGPTAVPATGVNVVSPTEITATTAGATKAGTFNLFVLEDGESSSANSGDYYTYTATHVSVASRTPRGAPNKPRLRAPRVRRPPPARETHGRHSVTPVGPVSSPSGRLALGAR